MKKLLSLVLGILITVLFVVPVSAETLQSPISIENQVLEQQAYAKLDAVSESFISEDTLVSEKFSELSSKSESFLESIDVDPDSVGKISYELEDDVLVLKVVSLLEDDKVSVTSVKNLGEDENGEYVPVNNTDMLSEFRSISWYTQVMEDTFDTSTVKFVATMTQSYSYTDLLHIYVRPTATSLQVLYKSSSHPTVTNLTANAKVSGSLFDYNYNLVARDYTWSTYYNIASVSIGQTYNRIASLPNGTMIGSSPDFVFYATAEIAGVLTQVPFSFP